MHTDTDYTADTVPTPEELLGLEEAGDLSLLDRVSLMRRFWPEAWKYWTKGDGRG